MKIGRWEGNEIIYTTDVVDNSVNLVEDFDFAFDIIGDDTIITGMVVTEAVVPDMTILISAGIAEDFTVGTFLVGEALIGTVTTSDPVNDRVDIVEMRRLIDDTTPATRQFKDPITEAITSSTIDTKTEYKTEIQVTAGTPAGSPVAPSVTSGWMKLAEILVPSSSTTVVNANIYNVDAEKEGDTNTSWTTDLAVVYRNGTISEMKTIIIDNEAVAALNTTHRTSDGTDHTFIDQDVKTTASPTFVAVDTGHGANEVFGKAVFTNSVSASGTYNLPALSIGQLGFVKVNLAINTNVYLPATGNYAYLSTDITNSTASSSASTAGGTLLYATGGASTLDATIIYMRTS